MAINSQRQQVGYARQDILPLAERVVEARTRAQEAEQHLMRAAQAFQQESKAAREATYHYVECLEARLKAAVAA